MPPKRQASLLRTVYVYPLLLTCQTFSIWLLVAITVVPVLAYTFILILGMRAAYKGPQLWKVMSRTSSIFMINFDFTNIKDNAPEPP